MRAAIIVAIYMFIVDVVVLQVVRITESDNWSSESVSTLCGYLFICWLECVRGCHWNGIAQPWLFSVELVWSVLGTVNQVSQSMRIEVRTDCVDVKWKHWVYQTYKFKCYFGTLLFWDLCHVHVDWRLDLQTWDMLRVHIRDLLVPDECVHVRHNTYVTGETHVTAACP